MKTKSNFKTHLKMKKIVILIIVITVFLNQSCLKNKSELYAKDETLVVDSLINAWHFAAANANFESYFGLMDDDFVFLGTDATEHWTKNEFANYSKPYFDKGKAWKFTTLKRNIYYDSTSNFAWFDEILETSFKICRGSGVLKRDSLNHWKFKQYVLSMTVPNEISKEIVLLKDSLETKVIKNIKK